MRRLTLAACALRFFDSFLLIAPFYTVIFAEHGLSPAQIGVALASWSIMGVILEVPCGVLADRASRRWLLASAQLVRAAGFLLWLAFPGFWGFLVGLMLWGFKSATFNGCFEAVVYDELKALGREGDYARVIGRTQAARAGGIVLASLAAAPLAPFGDAVLILGSFAGGLVAACAALTLPHAPKSIATTQWGYLSHLVQGARQAASLPGVASLLVFIAGAQAVLLAVADYWQLIARELGLSKPQIALFVAGLSLIGVIGSIQAHRVRGLPLMALYLMLAAGGAALVVSALFVHPLALIGPALFVGVYWLVDVNTDARFQHRLVPETRATVGSVKGFAMQLATSGLMLGLGLAAQAAGAYRAVLIASGAAGVLLGAGYGLGSLVLRSRSPPAPRPR